MSAGAFWWRRWWPIRLYRSASGGWVFVFTKHYWWHIGAGGVSRI